MFSSVKGDLWQFLPRNPHGAGARVGLWRLDRHTIALGVALDLEGLLRPEDNFALALPPPAGRALLVVESGSLHGWSVAVSFAFWFRWCVGPG